MHLGVISCIEDVAPNHITILDKFCNKIWGDHPEDVRFYNLTSESNESTNLISWCNLYFCCKFIIDANKKLPRTISLSNLNLSGGLKSILNSTPSPRSNSSTPSPRKLSNNSITNFSTMANSCTHIFIIGISDYISQIVKMFPTHKIFIISS